MAYSDKDAWEHVQAAFEVCKHYVEVHVVGRAEPIVAKALLEFDDDGFIEVRVEGNRTIAVRAEMIVTIAAV